MDAAAKTSQIKAAVFELVAYFSLFDIPISMERLVDFLPLKANHLAVSAAIRELITDKKVVRIGDEYGLKRHTYSDRKTQLKLQQHLLNRAENIGGLLGRIPFVKAVVVVNSVAFGDVTPKSDIDLLIVTTPGRIFLASRFITAILRMDRARHSEGGGVDLDMLLTVRGVQLDRDIMRRPDPHLRYWLLTARPVYGEKRWAEILQSSAYFRDKAPNMLWPRGSKTIDRWSWRWLDALDDRRYRRYLKRNSETVDHRDTRCFIRIRPDIINIHLNDKSEEIAARWEKLCQKLKLQD